MIRYSLPLGIFLVLVVFLYLGLYLNPRELESTLLNKPLPVFSLPQVNDPQKTIQHLDLQGKISMLNVWASWCVSCRQEHPLLMELARQKVVALYGLNWKDTLADAQDWLKQRGNPYQASAFDHSGRVGIDYGVTGTPETFLIDKKGLIRYKHVGPLTVDDFEKKIWPLIEKLNSEPIVSSSSTEPVNK